MKEILLSATVWAAMPLLSFSQISISAGPTYSSWRNDNTSYRFGFDVGSTYTFQNDSSLFCANAGLFFLNRGVNLDCGTKYENANEYKFRATLYSLHVPASVGYKIRCCKDRIVVEPKAGIYADLGLFGKLSQDKQFSIFGYKAKYDGKNPYTDLSKLERNGIQDFNRFDWGWQLGFDIFLSRQVFLQLNYDYGMKDVFETSNYHTKYSSFLLNLGYMLPRHNRQEPKMVEL